MLSFYQSSAKFATDNHTYRLSGLFQLINPFHLSVLDKLLLVLPWYN